MSPSTAESEWSPFYLIDNPFVRCKAFWDPWVVRSQRKDQKLSAAQKTILRLNSTSFDHRFDPVVLLPASSNHSGCQGGSDGFDLYSIRSPSTLPFRVILYTARKSRLMLRKGCQSVPFETFLTAFKRRAWKSLPSDRIWKFLLADGKKLGQLGLCERVREELYRRWWLVNGFPFRELPGELRNMVIFLVLDPPELYSPGELYRWREHEGKFSRAPLPPTDLYLVSKQMMQETKSLMFKRTTFKFYHATSIVRFTKNMTTASLATIRSIRLTMEAEELLGFFRTPIIGRFLESTHMGHEYVNDEARPCQLFSKGLSMTHHLSSLHTFEIVFPYPKSRSNLAIRHVCQRVYCWAIFAKAYKYLKGIPNVKFSGCIKQDQKACFLQLLSQNSEETIEECVASPESEHFDRMGLNTIRNGRCDCKRSCTLYQWGHPFDYDSHDEDRNLPENSIYDETRMNYNIVSPGDYKVSSDDLSDFRWTFQCIGRSKEG